MKYYLNKRRVSLAIAIGIITFIALGYQNCSDTRLMAPDKYIIVSAFPDSFLCTRAADLFSNQLKVLFVVDMSYSNIMPGSATDPDVTPPGMGLRFQKMIDFINGCGSQNVNNRFAITSFSGNAIKGTPSGTCPQSFVPQAAAVQKVRDLALLQTQDIARIPNPITMQNTTYMNGLNCASSTIGADISANPTDALNTNYLVFFVTDGKPTDNCDTTVPGNINSNGTCINNITGNPSYEPTIVNLMILGKSKASSIRLQPIYYGPASEQAAALQILDFFAQLGDSKQTILIQNAANIDFCAAANEPINTTFHMSEFNVINLTSIMREKTLQSDSDMDGVIDSEDDDPRNARSNPAQLLDGVCEINGGSGYCQRPSGCSMSRVTPMHLTNCDLVSLQLTDGADTDLDRIPDFIEITRATDPIIGDALDNLDNDGKNNIAEIRIGRQVDYYDDNVNSSYLTKWTKSIIPPSAACPQNQENWKFSISQVPLVSTLNYTDPMDNLFPGSKFSMSHEANENVIFVYYIIEPVNVSSGTVAKELWGAVIKVSSGNPSPQITLQSSDFQKLGLINGVQP